jgi:CDGSH-type Zn-finger protein
MADQNKNAEPKNCRIKVTKNGPYLVEGNVPLSEQIIIADSEKTATQWQEGKKYPSTETYALCRCGQSKNKPFCDGTHAKANFNGVETATYEPCLQRAKDIDGPELKLSDVEDLCASARFCHRAGGIWMLIPKSNDPEAKKIAIEEACDCPSGRLILYDKEQKETKELKCTQSIGIVEDPQIGGGGPIFVKGGIIVESAKGKTYEVRNRVTLCRCGKSRNKPFCDSSHYPE